MKKLFLTSGLVLCLACPAFAENGPYDITDDNETLTTGADATCQYPTLGSYTGPSTFYAKWQAKEYTVTYKPGSGGSSTIYAGENEASSAGQQTTAVFDGSYTIYANDATLMGDSGLVPYSREGYNFAGWKSDYNLASGAEAETTYTGTTNQEINPYKVSAVENVDLVAQWTPISYNVIYHPNGHALNGESAATDVTKQNAITYDATYTLQAFGETEANAVGNPGLGWTVAPGYSFNGWGRTANTEVGALTGYIAATENVGNTINTAWTEPNNLELFAIYTANQYRLTYDCGDITVPANISATGEAITHTGDFAGALESAHSFDFTFATTAVPTALDPNVVCKIPGYTASAWSCEDENGDPVAYNTITTGDANGKWSVPSHVTCSVDWTANDITLKWKVGTTATKNQLDQGGSSCTYDTTIDVAGTPTRAGYEFLGWSTTPQDSSITQYEADPVVNNNNNNNGGGDNGGETPTGEEPEQTEP